MKKLSYPFLLSILMSLVSFSGYAYNIAVQNSDGVVIYYNFCNDGKELEVTKGSISGNYSGDVVIPEEVNYDSKKWKVSCIDNYAFSECTYLSSITIPNSVTTIENGAFYQCLSLTSVHISDLAAWCNISFSNNYSNPLCYAHHLYLKGEEIKDVTIPNNITSIGQYSFQNCLYLTSVTIPNSVTSIEGHAFEGCSGLTSIKLPNSLTSIGVSAFADCTSLTSVHISDLASWCNISFSNYNSNPLSFAHHLFLNGEEIKDVDIPFNVTAIKDYAFYSCSNFTSVTIPNSVTSIGNWAFYGCSGLTSITIPNGVKTIGVYAFNSCFGLNTITIPNSVTTIEDGAFFHCTGLTSVIIPDNVTSIGQNAFRDCPSLTLLNIGNGITTIGEAAFAECSELNKVYIGSSIKDIGSWAFADCPKIDAIYCYATRYPTTGGNAFTNSYPDYITLYVPEKSVAQYKNVMPWKAFYDIVPLEYNATDIPGAPKCEKPTISYSKGQLVMSCATEGVEYITDISDTDIKQHYSPTITLSATYEIRVYAIKQGYNNSDVVTATLCWIANDPETNGTVNNILDAKMQAVLIQSSDGTITIDGLDDNMQVLIYSADGMPAGSAISQNGSATIHTNMTSGSVAIVKIGQKAVKVFVK